MQVQFTSYVEEALELVNSEFRSIEDISAILGERPWLVPRAREGDLRSMRRLQAELSTIVDASATGDRARVVQLVNEALERFPVTACVSNHDGQPWHLHVGDSHRSVPEVLGAEALFGLAVLISELGPDRLGRCVAPGCARAFADTTAKRSRRYCSTRCSTRTNVAAHRRRLRSTPSGTVPLQLAPGQEIGQ